MNNKRYEMKLITYSPVHIGSGEVISKKNYVLNTRKNKIEFLNEDKLFKLLYNRNLLNKFEEYTLSNGRRDMSEFISKNNLDNSYSQAISYSIEADNLDFRANKSLNNINLTIKDAFNKPYIPGSSIKGSLVNAILFGSMIEDGFKNSPKYSNFAEKFEKLGRYVDHDFKREYKNIIRNVEEEIKNYSENIFGKRIGDLISVSDTNSLSCKDLTLAQKVDERLDIDDENKLNVLRECIDDNKELKFTLNVEENKFFDIDIMMRLISKFFSFYSNRVREIILENNFEGPFIYLGGGTGFINKTLVYGLFNEEDDYQVASKILMYNFPKIRRDRDMHLQVSPKTFKSGLTSKGFQEMGLCKLEILK